MPITGKEFKNKNKNTKFYILLDKDIKIGIIKKKFKDKDDGLKFIDLNFTTYIHKKIKYIGEIELYEDSLIYNIKESEFYGTDKLYLKNKILVEDFELWNSEKFCLNAINYNLYIYKYVIYTETIKNRFIYTVNIIGIYLKYFRKEEQTYNLCLLAVNSCGRSLKYVREDIKDSYLCNLAVLNNNSAFQYVKKELQDYNMCFIAVNKDANNFKYVRKDLQDYKLCVLSSQKRCNLEFVRKDLLDKKLFEMFINNIINKN